MRRRLLAWFPARALVALGVGVVLGAVLGGNVAPSVSDRDGEVWWTTMDCPPGVEPPCLDNTVSFFEVREYDR